MSKTIIVLTFVSILAQIIFSFYYSSNIVNQNNQLDEYKVKYQELRLDLSEYKKQLSDLTSIQRLQETTSSGYLAPNKKSIKISNF